MFGHLQAYLSDGRFQHLIVFLEGVQIHIFNVYCKVSDSSYNEKFMRELQHYVAGLGNVPNFLGVISNPMIPSSVFQLLFHHGWQSLVTLFGLEGVAA